MEKIVIVGGVAAGATAAAKARRLSPDAQIILLEAGADISFANCGLPYYIGGDIKNRSSLILQSPESFKEQYDVDVYTHTIASSIDKDAHVIKAMDTRSGEYQTFQYTKLILAQGGRPVKPIIPGADLQHVFTLWTLEDMDNIDSFIKERAPKSAAVVGGGFIGLEMAEALAKRGLKVSVIEMMPHVMPMMDAETAGFITGELLSYSVGVHTNVSVTSIQSSNVTLNSGETVDADMVLLSVGVRPTLQLAKDSGLAIGAAGGLLVNEYLQTSDPDIFAAGDMVEIEHRVLNSKVRIPLAGPANRQGRIAAENALGGSHRYKGAMGTSVVRVFEAVAGSTGLSLKQARNAGIDADAVAVHKEHHTAYYPGAEQVSVYVVYDRKSGLILGGQTAGYKGADKRLDVIAAAIASKSTVHDLADLDLSYSPPIGTPNDAINMAAYAAENNLSGYSTSIISSEIDEFVSNYQPVIVDVRDIFSYEKGHVQRAVHIPHEMIRIQHSAISSNRKILVYDETGKKGHQAARSLKGLGFKDVYYVSGGFTSLQRYARSSGFHVIKLDLLPLEKKSINTHETQPKEDTEKRAVANSSRIIIDVRTPLEYKNGAIPEAINIPLDEVASRLNELGNNPNREIIVYCASGARSAYAQKIIAQAGFKNVTNGGGIANMMSYVQRSSDAKKDTPLIVDVRTPNEFSSGAFPGAVNIPLDEFHLRINELGSKNRDITLYCASGARSSYALRILEQSGFTNAKNGGGLVHMMMRK